MVRCCWGGALYSGIDFPSYPARTHMCTCYKAHDLPYAFSGGIYLGFGGGKKGISQYQGGGGGLGGGREEFVLWTSLIIPVEDFMIVLSSELWTSTSINSNKPSFRLKKNTQSSKRSRTPSFPFADHFYAQEKASLYSNFHPALTTEKLNSPMS